MRNAVHLTRILAAVTIAVLLVAPAAALPADQSADQSATDPGPTWVQALWQRIVDWTPWPSPPDTEPRQATAASSTDGGDPSDVQASGCPAGQTCEDEGGGIDPNG